MEYTCQKSGINLHEIHGMMDLDLELQKIDKSHLQQLKYPDQVSLISLKTL